MGDPPGSPSGIWKQMPPVPTRHVPDLDEASERHRTALQRYLRVLGCAPDRVDDVVQECFVVLLRDGFEHRGDGATRHLPETHSPQPDAATSALRAAATGSRARG